MNRPRSDAIRAADALRQRRHRAAAPKPASLPPSFIAVDGEGRNVDGIGSRHLYTLLAASSGEYVERVAHGLSTVQCLDFLLSLKVAHQHTVLVGFAINYDVNMLLGDVPTAALTRLWQAGSCLYFAKAERRTYRLSYVPSKWFGVSLVERRGTQRRWQTVKGATARVWDVWGFFQSRFVTVLETWLADEQEAIAAIAHMKDARGDFGADDSDAVRAYCLTECTLLVRVMDKLAAALWGLGLHLTQWLGAGAIASAMLRQQEVKETLRWDDWPEPIQDAALWAYFGGRVELFKQGIMPVSTFDYDVRSAYPTTIAELPSLAGCEWGKAFDEYDIDYARWGMVHVTWDTRGHQMEWLAPFPQHFEGGRVGWQAVGEGWYHFDEYKAARRIFGSCITLHDAYILLEDGSRPFAFVREFYSERAKLKAAGDPRHYPLKVGLNSLYGKLAQSMARDQLRRPPFQNFFLAGAVTAATRAKVLTMLARAGRERAVMAATDGVFLSDIGAHATVIGRGAGIRARTLAAALGMRLGDELGDWELTTAAPAMVVVQAGVYWEVPQEGVTPRVRTRGFGVKSVKYDDAVTLFQGEQKASHSYAETRFIGLGYSVNTGDFSQWRRWVTVERTLARSLEPHRSAYFSSAASCATVDPGVYHDASKRRPYLTRSERLRTPDSEQLDALQELEQPEGAGYNAMRLNESLGITDADLRKRYAQASEVLRDMLTSFVLSDAEALAKHDDNVVIGALIVAQTCIKMQLETGLYNPVMPKPE